MLEKAEKKRNRLKKERISDSRRIDVEREWGLSKGGLRKGGLRQGLLRKAAPRQSGSLVRNKKTNKLFFFLKFTHEFQIESNVDLYG